MPRMILIECTDFSPPGIRVRHYSHQKSMKTSHDVCYKGQMVNLDLTAGEFVSIEYWYLNTVRPDSEVQCYMWGNYHGDLPKYFNPDVGPQEIIQDFKVCCLQLQFIY